MDGTLSKYAEKFHGKSSKDRMLSVVTYKG